MVSLLMPRAGEERKTLETQTWLVLFDIFKGLKRHPSHIRTTFYGFLSPTAHKNSCNSLYYGTTAIQRSCFLSRPLLFEKQPVFLLQPHHKTYSLHDPCLQMPLVTRAKDGCATRLHILSDSISLENGPSRIQKKMLLVENTVGGCGCQPIRSLLSQENTGRLIYS